MLITMRYYCHGYYCYRYCCCFCCYDDDDDDGDDDDDDDDGYLMMMVLFRGILSHFSEEIPQLIDITVSAQARYGHYLTTVHFQKYLVNSNSHTRPLHSPR